MVVGVNNVTIKHVHFDIKDTMKHKGDIYEDSGLACRLSEQERGCKNMKTWQQCPR